MSRNHMQLSFDAISVNEAFARMAAAAFLMELDPTMEELDDVKTAVSEAVTNAIIHGYPGDVESWADGMEHRADGMEHRADDMEHWAEDMEHRADGIEHLPDDMMHLPDSMKCRSYLKGKADESASVPQVELICTYEGRKLTVIVRDRGVGIANIAQARQPFYTSKPELERSGMGFAFMEAFMDELQVESAPGEGTCVTMTKYIGGETSSDSSGSMEEKTGNVISVNCIEEKAEIVSCESAGEDA